MAGSAMLLALQACSDGSSPVGPGPEPRIGMAVVSDQAQLDQRVQRQSTVVPLSNHGMSTSALHAAGGPSQSTFLHVASVLPPSVDGQSLPATHIVTYGNLAYVSYASVTQVRLGAVDVFDCKDPSKPQLISSASFTGTKVFSLALDASGSTLYLGTSTSDTGFANPAVVEAIPLDHGKLTGKSIRQSVNSWAVTGVYAQGGALWVTSGNGGGLPEGGVTLLDASTLKVKMSDPFSDARGVAGSGSQLIAARGQPGSLRVYGSDGGLRTSVSAGGLDTPDAKSTVALSGNWGFMSLGSTGAAAFRVNGNQSSVVAKFPAASVPAGVDPGDVVTNAVAPISLDWYGGVVFTADGGAGIRVWYSNYPSTSTSSTPYFLYLGSLQPSLNLPGSSNMVGTTPATLLAANGLGGLRLFYFKFD
jgi:hypothetical protein